MLWTTRLPVGLAYLALGTLMLAAGAGGQLPTLPPAEGGDAAPPAQTATGQVPAKPTTITNSLNWDALSCQVIPGLVAANIDMGTILLSCRSASCVIDVVITPQAMAPMRARLSCAWEDANDDGELSDGEITIEADTVSHPNMRPMLRDVNERLKSHLKRNGMAIAARCTIKTRKADDGYLMTIQTGNGEAGGGLELRTSISPDLRVTKIDTGLEDGTTISATYHYVRVGQQWIPDECVEQVKGRGGELMTRQKLGYEKQADVPMLTRISAVKTMSSIAGAYSIREEYTAHDWKVVKRDKPLDAMVLLAKAAGIQKTSSEESMAMPDVKIERTAEARALAERTLRQVADKYTLV